MTILTACTGGKNAPGNSPNELPLGNGDSGSVADPAAVNPTSPQGENPQSSPDANDEEEEELILIL